MGVVGLVCLIGCVLVTLALGTSPPGEGIQRVGTLAVRHEPARCVLLGLAKGAEADVRLQQRGKDAILASSARVGTARVEAVWEAGAGRNAMLTTR